MLKTLTHQSWNSSVNIDSCVWTLYEISHGLEELNTVHPYWRVTLCFHLITGHMWKNFLHVITVSSAGTTWNIYIYYDVFNNQMLIEGKTPGKPHEFWKQPRGFSHTIKIELQKTWEKGTWKPHFHLFMLSSCKCIFLLAFIKTHCFKNQSGHFSEMFKFIWGQRKGYEAQSQLESHCEVKCTFDGSIKNHLLSIVLI